MSLPGCGFRARRSSRPSKVGVGRSLRVCVTARVGAGVLGLGIGLGSGLGKASAHCPWVRRGCRCAAAWRSRCDGRFWLPCSAACSRTARRPAH
eukprot:1184083-Prorocentrum_minimum.AAC.2